MDGNWFFDGGHGKLGHYKFLKFEEFTIISQQFWTSKALLQTSFEQIL
jgi:hypothetical protein